MTDRCEVEPFGIQVGYLQAGGVRTGPGLPTGARAGPPTPMRATVQSMPFAACRGKGPVPHAVGAAVIICMEFEPTRPVIPSGRLLKLMPWLKRLFPESIFRAQLRRALGL